MSEIKPALTAVEWRDRRILDDIGVLDICAIEVWKHLSVNGAYSGERRRALAALALHGQPFGFTWADVDLLRRASVIFRVGDMETAQDDRATSRLRDLADRIEALLPPREETKP